MEKYVMYRATAEASQFKEYYPLCTTNARILDWTEYEVFETLSEALDEISRPVFYYPELNNRGSYVEYFIQREEYDEEGEFIQALEIYDWNFRSQFVWREKHNRIEVFEFEVVQEYMDDEICEEINKKYLFKSEQDFFTKYLELHEEKYGEEFEI